MTDLSEPTDGQLVAQVLAGQQAAYRLIVERHQQAVYNAAYRLVGHQDEAADITQDAFLRGYQALASFQKDRSLAPWLCRISINLALNRLKQRRPTISLEADTNRTVFEIPDQSAEPQVRLLKAEKQVAIRRALLELPAEQRLLIELRHFQGLSYEEIAKELELSLANVKVRLFRTRKKLRKILEKRGDV